MQQLQEENISLKSALEQKSTEYVFGYVSNSSYNAKDDNNIYIYFFKSTIGVCYVSLLKNLFAEIID